MKPPILNQDIQPPTTIEQIRQFNRFYTQQMGILNERFLNGPLTLPELRVLFEVAQYQRLTISDLVNMLRLDQGYASRLVSSLKKQQLIQVEADPEDGRKKQIILSERGQSIYAELEQQMCDELQNQLVPLSASEQQRLTDAMGQITQLLQPEPKNNILIRPIKTGELGLIAQRHAILYQKEHGWDHQFEHAVMQVMADYLQHLNSANQNAWVAEVNGNFAGCIFAVQEDVNTARLRALLVEPEYRGLGLGQQLIEQCLSFCLQHHYKKVVLWTCDALIQARRLYQSYGFECTKQWPETEFGKNLQSEHWELIFPS